MARRGKVRDVYDLGDRLDAGRDVILDGGACPIGVESTIVDCTSDPVQVLRAGAVTADQIRSILDGPVASASGPARRAPEMSAVM